MALLFVVTYYLLAFRPGQQNSAQIDSGSSQKNLVSNPIDEYLLYWRLGQNRNKGLVARLAHILGVDVNRALANVRCTISIIMFADINQCMLIMSDFQMITGLSILISGYTQLRCGLQAYYWQRVVYLAWFSSITHLCCLTFLREYFSRNKVAYCWRLPGMIILILMLVVAYVPTAH
jgi:hypothetical protein